MHGFSAAEQLEAERRLIEGAVPAHIDAALRSTPTYQISADAFLLRLPMGLAFHYQRGFGTVYERASGVSDDEVALFFEGSVYGAIAWLNGLVPLHASAIAHQGNVYAFTGASGEGKSTLVAALAQRGMTACADDVLVLDLADPDAISALPGPKRLKLWEDALALTGRTSRHAVRPGIDKYYVSEESFARSAPLPLKRLYFLESLAAVPGVTAIAGAQRFNWLRSAYYRPHFCGPLAEQRRYFETAARLSGTIGMARFNRSRDKAAFDASVDLIMADISAAA